MNWMSHSRSHGRSLINKSALFQRLVSPPLIFRDFYRFSKTSWSRAEVGSSRVKDPLQIVMLAVSNMHVDPRIEREARALAAAGYNIIVIWPEYPSTMGKFIDWGQGITFKPLSPAASGFQYRFPGFFADQLLKAALEYYPLAYHAHDLNTALAGILASKRRRTSLVCDFHEWYSENVSWSAKTSSWAEHPIRTRQAYRWLERKVFKHASAVITVCDSIARELEHDYAGGMQTVTVIRNIPPVDLKPTRTYRNLREELGVDPNQFLLLWQGGVGPSRMIEPIINALEFAPRCILAIRGPGLDIYGPEYCAIASRIGAADRLILLPSVPSRDVVAAAAGADAGVWTLPNLCKNFYYALPNKVWEYLAAGLPLLCADFPEVKRLVDTYQVGLCFDPYDPQSIAAAINQIIEDPKLRQRFAKNTRSCIAENDPVKEWDKLVRLYRTLAARPTSAPIATVQ